MVKFLLCNLKAIPFWIYTGVFAPHTYSDIIEHKKDVYVNEKGKIRLADGFQKDDEIYVKNATIKTSICVYCGKVNRRMVNKYGKN